MLRLALRNIFRQKLRASLTLAAVVFGVVALVLSGGFVQDVFFQLGEAFIHSQSGHIQAFRAGYFEQGTRSPEKFSIEHPETVQNMLAAMPQVAETMTRLSFSGMINNGRTDLAIIGEGIEPDKELRLGSRLMLLAGHQLRDAGRYEMLVGAGVARALKLKPGSRVTLLVNTAEGALNSLDFETVGIFQSYSKDYDARAIRIPLSSAKELLNTSGVTSIVVRLHRTEDTQQVAQELRARVAAGFEVKTWVALNDFYEKVVTLYRAQFGALQVIILVVVLLGVANAVSMSVLERVGEFGTIRALGNRSGYVFRLVMVENMLLGLAGATLGLLLGCGLALLISEIGIPMPPPPNADLGYTAHILIVPFSLLTAFATGVSTTVLAAILPARRASRTPVVDALRQNV